MTILIVILILIIILCSSSSDYSDNSNKSKNSKKTQNKTNVIYYGNEFKNNKTIKKVNVSDSITSIGAFAFYDCNNLQNIEIPNSIISIGDYAFKNCTSLQEIKIPNSLISIGTSTFYDCSNLQKIKIPNSLTSIGDNTFCGCSNLQKIELSSSIVSIGDYAFKNCTSLQEIKIPNSLISIGDNAFWGCSNLQKIEIPDSVTSIGHNVFTYCKNICIYCNKESYTEEYAREYNISFKYITNNNLQNQLKKEVTNSSEDKTSKSIKIEKTDDNKNYKKDEIKGKIEFLSAQAKSIITDISNVAYEEIDKIDKDKLSYSIRVDIFDKKLNRANGNKNLYADSLKLNILYYFNLIEDINKYITLCIESNKFPTSGLEWESKFKQLQNSNKIYNINKAKNKNYLQEYDKFDSIDKLISDLEWDYTYFYINSSILINCLGSISVNEDFIRPLLNESPSSVIKEFEKCCHLKTSIILKSIEKTLFGNKQNLAVNNSKSFKKFYSSKTSDQLKNDVDEVYYTKLKELNLKDASFGNNGSKEFLGAVELALFDEKIKSYIDTGIENIFTRNWGSLDFSEYMDEVVEKYSKITIDEWNESYRYFEKNHSWLDKHPCASSDVAQKRFEFLQQRNSNLKENIENKESGIFLKEIQWENSTTEIKELTDLFIMDNFPSTLGSSSYYLSYYICPDCNKRLLYKVKTRGVKTIFEGQTKNLFNIFTCPKCKRFYASIASSTNPVHTSTRLSDFALRSIAYTEDDYANLIIYTQGFEN